MRKYKIGLGLIAVIGLALLLASCAQQECPECPAAPECPEAECPEVTCPTCPEPEACPDPVVCPSAVKAPFEALWSTSAHADAEAEAFRHWDGEDPAEVPVDCAKCHSETGYIDYVGADGSTVNVVDNSAPIGTVISCVACHNEGTVAKSSVIFPSGVEITGLGPEARCMECHQGRASMVTVDESIAAAGVEADTVSENLGFINIHYYAAAATQAGKTAMGGYQYTGKAYDSRFDHVAGYDTCVGCHNSHTLEIKTGRMQYLPRRYRTEGHPDARFAGRFRRG